MSGVRVQNIFPKLQKKIKHANAQTSTTKKNDTETQQRQWFTDTDDRTPAGNMGLASCGVTCLNSSAVFQINFSTGLTVLCPEIPHERQAQKRQNGGFETY